VAAENTDTPRLHEQLCFALYATSRAFTKLYGGLLAEMGITYPQYLVLLVLWEEDGLTVNHIADRLEIEGATATPLIQRMEKLGLVTRHRSSEDERCVLVSLTKTANSYRERARQIPQALGCAAGVSPLEAKRILDDLNRIRANI
jgi:MarR family transcriptional regulator, organic hydroperoxide resistance regulator